MADSITRENPDVIVLGAGIVGVSTAYAVRQRGLAIVLVDRREPGSETFCAPASRRTISPYDVELSSIVICPLQVSHCDPDSTEPGSGSGFPAAVGPCGQSS